ncbi:chemotaxis protein CheB [Xanthobacter sp. DSM 24535]|uniref:chemotaxis protein CheB n=1 Tax=Roseixanthobacter psychrophilus TaxID=3119917 RepID=UPI00372A9D8A
MIEAMPAGPHGFPVVGIGASAGGLEACKKLLTAIPARSGMAFILVQHLDPTHESMMVDLLARHTSMVVLQATDGMTVERDHFYVIPPGSDLSIRAGLLRLSLPKARHGARLPFDFLLHSLAEAFGKDAVAVVLSGTGADGSVGVVAVKEKGGFVIAQEPEEAGYDGMPRSAIATGAVDLVLPVARIPQALITREPRPATTVEGTALAAIVELLRTNTAYDFTLYKQGTLQRRTERRMAMASIGIDGMDRYLEQLRHDPGELELLAKDLLINVTSFFRDPKVFEFLAQEIVPDLVRNHARDQPLRLWVAGCSSGEETYSLAMLFFEAIAAAQRPVRLQVFASDIDADAVALAREGFYPKAIEAEVSTERLARFFSREENGYRVGPDLRAAVVFTVQNVLADPPFSRLDMISCRNLLIYLGPQAQDKVVSLFHFALREGGILLLGTTETVGNAASRFEILSKSERLYRHTGRSRPGELGFSVGVGDTVRVPVRPSQGHAAARQNTLAELCRRLVLEAYAPAAVLINRKYECLYYLGSTDDYLRLAPGLPMHDLLSLAREGVRTKLRAAIQRASQEGARVVVDGGRITRNGESHAFSIAVQPVQYEGEDLLLICFIDAPAQNGKSGRPPPRRDLPRVAELEQELDATRMELQGAIRNLEISSEEQKAVNEEALSVNEEFQSTNEELLASKEELQSLNEELTALNGQLQETLERQRTTSNDLQNVLYSTDVATLFLDTELKIRFFTPETRLLFNLIPGDVGRPLSDLSSLAGDGALLSDATAVLKDGVPHAREIAGANSAWYLRRILPYRTPESGIGGVVITFVDITEQRRIAGALEAAKREAELANAAKSRFLAAASHDLRQPLQSLVLLQGLLAKSIEGEKGTRLVLRLDEAISAMSGMLNALLDINQIEAGTIRASVASFPIDDLLNLLKEELTYHAHAKKLVLRVIPCGISIESDPRLLEQMIRNLISNALKYTSRGRVLVGCRRHGGLLRIEVWDTGIGIPDRELQAIFEEYHQVDNAARERSRGLGLGLSIVQRLGLLLGHRVHVRSVPGKGSVFSIDVGITPGRSRLQAAELPHAAGAPGDDRHRPAAAILVVDDDPDVRSLLELSLTGEGHMVAASRDAVAALEMVERGTIRPDLILADYNLPNGVNGLQAAKQLRAKLQDRVPVIILTGDISKEAERDIALGDCVQLTKPVKPKDLAGAMERLLRPRGAGAHRQAPPAATGAPAHAPVVFIVDDDSHVRESMRSLLEEDGRIVEDYDSCEAFLAAYHPGRPACLLVDAYLPGMNGLELLQRLHDATDRMPAIMITGNSDVPTAVQAMKAGAVDFIEKPASRSDLLAAVAQALEQSRDADKSSSRRADAESRLASLTERQRQILDLVLAGHPSKNIAADLGLSQRTVENHRASIMRKTGSKSLPALARLALASSWKDDSEPFA